MNDTQEKICDEPGCNNLGRAVNYKRLHKKGPLKGKPYRNRSCSSCYKRAYKEKNGKTIAKKTAENAGYKNESQYSASKHKYKKHRKQFCENIDARLGFKCTSTIIDHWYQLEVDHIDSNKNNNSKSNLQTLCACCHRIKTKYDTNSNKEAHKVMMQYVNKTNLIEENYDS